MTINTPNIRINFNTPPIEFNKEFLAKKNPIEKALIHIGAAADSYLHVGKQYFQAPNMTPLRVNGHAWKTALKVMSYVILAFTILLLPTLAIAKAIYKNWAAKNIPNVPVEKNNDPAKKPGKTEQKFRPAFQLLEIPKNYILRPISKTKNVLLVQVEEKPKNEKQEKVETPVLEEFKKKTPALEKHDSLQDLRELAKDVEFPASPEDQKVDNSILKHLEDLTEENLSPVEQFTHLFALARLAKLDNKNNTIRGKLMEETLPPQPPKMSEMLDKMELLNQLDDLSSDDDTPEYYFIKFPKRPILDNKFYNLSDFANKTIDKLIRENVKQIIQIRNKLSKEDRLELTKRYNILRDKAGPIKKEFKGVHALSESGKRLYVLALRDKNGESTFVSKEDFDEMLQTQEEDPNLNQGLNDQVIPIPTVEKDIEGEALIENNDGKAQNPYDTYIPKLPSNSSVKKETPLFLKTLGEEKDIEGETLVENNDRDAQNPYGTFISKMPSNSSVKKETPLFLKTLGEEKDIEGETLVENNDRDAQNPYGTFISKMPSNNSKN